MKKQKKQTQQGNGKKASNVKYMRSEVNNLLSAYYTIRDAVEGELAIKGLVGLPYYGMPEMNNGGGGNYLDYTSNIVIGRARRYLPMPNAEDQSPENLERYRSYVTRAVWYGATSRTLDAMTGQVFLRAPVTEIPASLQILIKDADGTGLTLEQLADRAVRRTLAYGRVGCLVDYPTTDSPTTKAQVESGDIRPTILIYEPWNIINWRTVQRGGRRILSLVVIRDVEEDDDGFELVSNECYRALELDPDSGVYTMTLYHCTDVKNGVFEPDDKVTPKDSTGQPFTEIPFMFFGSENNDVAPNHPPLYDLASLNVAHFRNSADYEESTFLVGQPTPVIIGVTEEWVTNVLKGAVRLGSRGSIALPPGASAELIQAEANSMPHEAMLAKEDQMVAIGAKLVQRMKTMRTATETLVETTSESTTLTSVSKNVSAGFEWAITIAQKFAGGAGSVKYVLNTDFDLMSMTPDEQAVVIKNWQAGALTWDEMRAVLKKAGLATEDDTQAKSKIQKDIKEYLSLGIDVSNPYGGTPSASSGVNSDGPKPAVRQKKAAAGAGN